MTAKLYGIEISEKQKIRIALALREFATAHPEIPADDFAEFDCDHPTSLADMFDAAEPDGYNCFTL